MKTLLMVAHGQPSAPDEAAQELITLSQKVAVFLPGWRVGAATLAQEGALAQQAGALGGGLVFPMFIASGWFTKTAIPARLAEVGGTWQILPPFGEARAVQDLALQIVADHGASEVLLAAHGSFKSPVPAQLAQDLAAQIADLSGVHRVEAGFIDQEPRLIDMRGFGPDAICLPYFAMAGVHVRHDIPDALQSAGFTGEILPALGQHPLVPRLIADLALAAIAAQ